MCKQPTTDELKVLKQRAKELAFYVYADGNHKNSDWNERLGQLNNLRIKIKIKEEEKNKKRTPVIQAMEIATVLIDPHKTSIH